MKKQKYYVVWVGREKGVFDTWDRCQQAILGFPGHRHQVFKSLEKAEEAFTDGWKMHWGKTAQTATGSKPEGPGLCVCAAYNMDTRVMECRGVWYPVGDIAFPERPIHDATNDIGDFLAIMHGLAHLRKLGSDPIYSDSITALSWVRSRTVPLCEVGSAHVPATIGKMIAGSLKWLNENPDHNPVCKWNVAEWGENPARFTRGN